MADTDRGPFPRDASQRFVCCGQHNRVRQVASIESWVRYRALGCGVADGAAVPLRLRDRIRAARAGPHFVSPAAERVSSGWDDLTGRGGCAKALASAMTPPVSISASGTLARALQRPGPSAAMRAATTRVLARHGADVEFSTIAHRRVVQTPQLRGDAHKMVASVNRTGGSGDEDRNVFWARWCPSALLVALGDHDDIETVRKAAAHANTPAAALAAVAVSGDYTTRSAAATNPGCPTAVLAALSADKGLLKVCAANPNCGAGTLQRLAQQQFDASNPDGCSEMLSNRNCDSATIEILSRHPVAFVRCAAASHRACPPKTLARLARDHHTHTRVSAAKHHRCPAAVVAMLADDNHTVVRVAAAANPVCPPEVLAVSALDEVHEVRSAVGSNISCAEGVLYALAGDDVSWVRKAVARNAVCPPELLEQLAQDRMAGVACVAVAHPDCPQSVLRVVAETAATTQARQATQEDREMWVSAANNRACDAETLTLFASSDNELVRRYARR